MKFNNVFILSPGRCGSMTIIKACSHIQNYTSRHESGRTLASHEKYNLKYPTNHIESDNRLSWFLGSIDRIYGNSAFYLKLERNRLKIIESYLKRKKYNQGIVPAFAINIFQQKKWDISNEGYKWAVKHYVNTVYDNIDYFLHNKSNKLDLDIDNPSEKFHEFWGKISAEGNIDDALNEFIKKYNSSH